MTMVYLVSGNGDIQAIETRGGIGAYFHGEQWLLSLPVEEARVASFYMKDVGTNSPLWYQVSMQEVWSGNAYNRVEFEQLPEALRIQLLLGAV